MALTRKEINVVMKAEYPLNLLYMIQNKLDGRKVKINVENVTEDMLRGLEYALSLLDTRGADILRMKYLKRMTTTEMVEIVGVKSVNSLADSAVNRLTKPSMLGYIVYGKQGFERMLSQYESNLPDSVLDQSIDDIEVSAYVHMTMNELHLETLRELTYLMPGTLQTITEKLSPMNIDEISKFFKALGENHPVWSLAEKEEKSYPNDAPKEGDLYKTIILGGKTIEIRYQRYEDFDPEHQIDYEVKMFEDNPEYTVDGFAFRNAQDEVCPYLVPKDGNCDGNFTCESCAYLSDRVEHIGICGCTAKRQRGAKTPLTGKTMSIAVVGELPVAQAIVNDEYKDVQFDHYENTGDLSVICQKQNTCYDIILVRCDVADALEGMQLVSKYKVNDKKVETPTVLISEPPTYTSELALAELVTSIAKKLNK